MFICAFISVIHLSSWQKKKKDAYAPQSNGDTNGRDRNRETERERRKKK